MSDSPTHAADAFWNRMARAAVLSILIGLTLASAQTRQRSVPGALGLAGFLAAPSALLVTRSLHRVSRQALGRVRPPLRPSP